MPIFVAGVHGSGKTTACIILSKLLGVDHYSASTLIKKHYTQENWSKTKATDEIRANQRILIRAVSNLSHANPKFLLDGHFTILNSRKEIEPISLATLKALKLKGAFIVESSTEEIYRRLAERDNELWDQNLISRMITAERKHAILFSRATQTPITFIESKNLPQESHRILDQAKKWLNLD